MGLDVYLYRVIDLPKKVELTKQYDEMSEALWEFGGREYAELTTEEKEQARENCKDLALGMGLLEDGSYPDETQIELPSGKYPDHAFKIGYFRSSYNSNGYDHVMRNAQLPDLYDIFDPTDRYEFSPDWNDALDTARDALNQMDKYRKSTRAGYGVMDILNVGLGKAKNEAEALDIYMRNLEEEHAFRSYSSADGMFVHDGLEAVAVINGTARSGKVYLICKTKEDVMTWYRQALEIVIETIEYVLAQPDPQNYYLHWSS